MNLLFLGSDQESHIPIQRTLLGPHRVHPLDERTSEGRTESNKGKRVGPNFIEGGLQMIQKKDDRPCVICNESRPEMFKIYFDGYIKLFKCLNCGFIAQFPGPGRNTIVNEYENRYTLGFLDQGREFMYPNRKASFENIANILTKIKSGGRLLDVGCGDGHFLHICAKKGLKCFGVEDSKILSSYATAKTDVPISQGQYHREMFSKNYFDIITFVQVIEHIRDPVTALETAKYHLKPDGILVIEVPSIWSPHFILYRFTGIKKFVRPPTGVIYSHFGYYSPKTLRVLTQKCGFLQRSLTTGNWQYKYANIFKIVDPLLNFLNIGGILYIGEIKK